MQRSWSSIIILWLTGVLAAAQLAKMSALAPLLRARFELGLPETGFLVSLLEIGGATLGFTAGLALARVGGRRALRCGLILLIGATLIESLASKTGALFVARGVEGIGYLLVVIAAPTLIAATSRNEIMRSKALALWSTFVPVGMGVGSMITGVAGSAFGLRSTFLLWALLCALGLAATSRIIDTAAPGRRVGMPSASAWLLTAGFGCYTSSLCALTALLPTYLVEQHGASIAAGSTIAGMVSLTALPGVALALHMIGSETRQYRALLIAGLSLLLAALLAQLVYRVDVLAICGVIAGLIILLGSVPRTLIFTRLPFLSGATTPDDPRIASANGLLTQFGATGALAGPPLGAMTVQYWGWCGLGILIGLLMIALFGLVAAAERI